MSETKVPIKRQIVFIREGDEIKAKTYHPETQVAAITDIGAALMAFMEQVILPEVDEKLAEQAEPILQKLRDTITKEDFSNAVQYAPQELTDEQRRIARTNLGLGTIDDHVFEEFLERIESLVAANTWQNGQISDPSDPNQQHEYWTGKYYRGKKVYGKLLDFGTLPTSGSKMVQHFIQGLDQFIYFHAMGASSTDFIVIPNPDVNTSNNAEGIGLRANRTNVTITVRQNWATFRAIITIEYVCTDR